MLPSPSFAIGVGVCGLNEYPQNRVESALCDIPHYLLDTTARADSHSYDNAGGCTPPEVHPKTGYLSLQPKVPVYGKEAVLKGLKFP